MGFEHENLFAIFIMVLVLLVILTMAGWVTNVAAPNVQRQQDIALYCKDWIASDCSSSDATLSDPRFLETDDRPGLLNTCAASIGKSPEEFPDRVNPEADWDKCRAKCTGCTKKTEQKT